MKFEITRRPTGYINGQDWPEVGGVIDLPAQAGDDMVVAGWLKRAAETKVETRPAPKRGETRKA